MCTASQLAVDLVLFLITLDIKRAKSYKKNNTLS